jgi:hypothetical protein
VRRHQLAAADAHAQRKGRAVTGAKARHGARQRETAARRFGVRSSGRGAGPRGMDGSGRSSAAGSAAIRRRIGGAKKLANVSSQAGVTGRPLWCSLLVTSRRSGRTNERALPRPTGAGWREAPGRGSAHVPRTRGNEESRVAEGQRGHFWRETREKSGC